MNEDEMEYLRKENKQLRSLLRRIHTATKQFYEPKTVTLDDCPYDEIKALYHRIMFNFPQPRKLTNDRKTAMRKRWREDLTCLGDWEAYFNDVSKKRFLMGKNANGWKADIDFFLRERSIVRAQEGKYDDR